jgi:orotate phosphoribosyltransferase
MEASVLWGASAPLRHFVCMNGFEQDEELCELLRRQGILYSTPSTPITHRTGEVSPWAFYSWHITLTEVGLRLAARSILRALGTFGSTQLASYGYTGLPLLTACILEGGGKFSGLSVREQRKTYLTNRRVDGVIDPGRSVVVIDDSLSSGTSLFKAILALEAEGLEVEGVIALVHFPYRGAKEWANKAGYRTVTLFDIWTDLEMAAKAPPQAVPPSLAQAQFSGQVPDDLPPAVVARRVAEHYLSTGQLLHWPLRLDQPYDAGGGTFVSIRRRSDDFRVARDGFWHFDRTDADAPRDVVLATIETLRRGPRHLTYASLAELKIGVTFFGPLEEVSPRKLDFERYGIVVRSKVWPGKLGGALPNTQVFISEIEQYRHARATNAKVAEGEPHTVYRHTLTKWVEPGEVWLPYGCQPGASTDWWRDEKLGQMITERARRVLNCLMGQPTLESPLPANLIPVTIEGVAVTVYADGLRGFGLSRNADLDAATIAAAHAASEDRRLHALQPDSYSITVSILHTPEALPGATRLLVERKMRRGLDAVTLMRDGQGFTLLPTVLVYNDWSPQQLLDVVDRQSGMMQAGDMWKLNQVAAWVSTNRKVSPLRFGFPARDAVPLDRQDAEEQIDRLAEYICRSLDSSGIPGYRLSVSDADYVREGTAARVVHALFALRLAGEVRGRSDWKEAAGLGVAHCLSLLEGGTLNMPRHIGGALADAVLLAAAATCGLSRTPGCLALASRVKGLVHASGWIGVGRKRLDNPQDQEFLPGATVWALGTYARLSGTTLPEAMCAARRFYGNRLREHPTWGCPWLAQGWAAVSEVTRDQEDADIAFTAADWAADRQLDKSGAFLEDLSPDEPSFNTGFVAEGIAAAWHTALAYRDPVRVSRYQECWRKALGFVRTLTLTPDDVFPFRSPTKAVGGVRCSISRSGIRIDQVSHTLHALVEGCCSPSPHQLASGECLDDESTR